MASTLGDDIRDSLETILDNLTDIVCTQIEQYYREPLFVNIVKEGKNEVLYIDCEKICSNKKISVKDILLALRKEEIINYEYKGE